MAKLLRDILNEDLKGEKMEQKLYRHGYRFDKMHAFGQPSDEPDMKNGRYEYTFIHKESKKELSLGYDKHSLVCIHTHPGEHKPDAFYKQHKTLDGAIRHNKRDNV